MIRFIALCAIFIVCLCIMSKLESINSKLTNVMCTVDNSDDNGELY